MDGTDSVVFNGLEISNVHEYSELGSDVCGRYWDGNFNGFTGGGNTLQNAPYLYGYTGNRAHGIFGDFAEYQFSGDVEISDLYCDTGLVRGIGMYRESELTFAADSTLTISGLSAGHVLYDEVTCSLSV